MRTNRKIRGNASNDGREKHRGVKIIEALQDIANIAAVCWLSEEVRDSEKDES